VAANISAACHRDVIRVIILSTDIILNLFYMVYVFE